MPRPQKYRRICDMPRVCGFYPEGRNAYREPVVLKLDEYEAVRLIDRERMTQEECGRVMGVARTTVQQIYTTARLKIADSLTECRPLRIEGGRYRLCEEREKGCCGRRCRFVTREER